MLDLIKERVQSTVEAAGATFVAVWELPDARLALFNSRATGSTLALPVADVLAPNGLDAVRRCLAESDAKFPFGRYKSDPSIL